jgi:asparagine synthase (glutamine-hydrolysing)
VCGIVGIFGKNANISTVDNMLRTQHHRGPDYTKSVLVNDNVVLGHNRLAIIDLNAHANQPMWDHSKSVVIVFNGEIYNYKELKEILKDTYIFRTNSDTEVILAAYKYWGYDMLEYLNGMFAFAIYDTQKKELFAARDRFGVKPFYYSIFDDTLYFASEIGTFINTSIPLTPSHKVWAEYLAYGSYGMPEDTFWEDIYQLKPGHYMIYREGLMQITKWYDFVANVSEINISDNVDEVLNHYEKLIQNSVELRFRADVPIGFNLSGGLDSSTLLAIVNHLYQNNNTIKAYTFYTGDDRYDEVYWVQKMLSNMSYPLQKVKLMVSDVPKLARELTQIQYEPYGGIPTLAYYNLFKQARKDGTLVLLDGQGMDEQWAGYDYYTSNTNSLVQGTTTSPTRINILNNDFLDFAHKPNYPKPFDDELKNLQYRDLFYTKIPRALRFNDRVSMASSVELREPFLDYHMVEYAFAQPKNYKIYQGQRKWMLRQIAQKYLQDEITTAPKRALQTPQREWLGDELSCFVEEQIENIINSKLKYWFDTDKLQEEWLRYKNGNQDNAFFIWQWVSLGLIIQTIRGK